MCICVDVYVAHMLQHMCRCQRTTVVVNSHLPLCVTELRSSDLAIVAFTHCVMLWPGFLFNMGFSYLEWYSQAWGLFMSIYSKFVEHLEKIPLNTVFLKLIKPWNYYGCFSFLFSFASYFPASLLGNSVYNEKNYIEYGQFSFKNQLN